MKNKILLYVVFFAICSCKPQNSKQEKIEKIKLNSRENEYKKLVNKEFEKFDINRFNKHKYESGDYIYVLNDGTQINEYGNEESGYFSEQKPRKSLFVISKGYYINSGIRAKGVKFGNVGCVLGIWYEFDENGRLVKETDFDKPFKITIYDIIEFLKNSDVDLYANTTSVNRFYDEKTKKGTWTLHYLGKFNDDSGKLIVKIDDESRKVQEVIKITGRRGEKEIIFEKK
ncbi:hypothetical protein [Flavobacterium humidisoli]|uniref:MORN repeat variant n=1 Tax=Flavobacterium humidisoli TaxID=2937442 RepID=A0ABY4LQC7_9FLAO|nr:hypothetical protein [Flavobacterium humidisoli]UPZ13855.1 hypothetical protein M0M44_13955 [Flavobacterium humidisoli]